jgi:ABC-type phosphate transport system substrate-binding protein
MKLPKVSVWIALAAACSLAASGARDAGAAGAFVVLVNGANPVSGLSHSELKRAITGGTKQWDSGAVVQVGIIPSDCPETQFLASMLDSSPRELLSRIQEQVFKGEMRRPASLHSSADCAAFARTTPGAICVAASSQAVPPEAHVVAIH